MKARKNNLYIKVTSSSISVKIAKTRGSSLWHFAGAANENWAKSVVAAELQHKVQMAVRTMVSK